jgi:hypothetical protein
MLFLLRSLLPPPGGRLKIDRIASATGMSKTNILAQLEALENVGLIKTLSRDVSGRLISFSSEVEKGIENDTGPENDTRVDSEMGTEFDTRFEFDTRGSSCSCFCNNKKTTTTTKTTTTGEPENETGIEFSTGIENDMGIGIDTGPENDTRVDSETGTEFDMGPENETGTEFDTDDKSVDVVFKNKLHNNVLSKKFSAQEFFFIAKASKVGIDKLTEQCFKYYHDMKGNMGKEYTNGLFLSLLSKAKDNPMAYVVKAIQQGATASPDDEIRAEKILKAGETVLKEIGVNVLRKEMETALSFLEVQSQETIRRECETFVARMTAMTPK